MSDEKEKIHKDDDILTKIQIWMNNNKKVLSIAGIGVLVAVGGLIAYKYLYLDKRESKAAKMMYIGKSSNGVTSERSIFHYYEKDSFRLAISGDSLTQGKGLVKVLNDYGSTNVGDAATYMMGMGNLHLGAENPENYDKAVKWLDQVEEDFDEDEILLTTMAIGAKGDALLEQGNKEGALAQYKKAAERKPNIVTTPYFLLKQAIVNEELGNWQNALDLYKKIKSDYPDSEQARIIEPYIGRAEYKAG